MTKSLNRVVVSRSALVNNFNVCARKSGGVPILAMVKADAYGHGMEECARVFSGCGVKAFGVAEVVEGVRLRRAGIREPIFILAGLLPEFIETVIAHDLTPVLVDGGMIDSLAAAAGAQGKTVDVHLKVDAGMGRQGCRLDQAPAVVGKIISHDSLHLAGIMAHFPMADDPVHGNSVRVLADFLRMTDKQQPSRPLKGCRLHIANSGAIFSVDGAALDMVRPGISLYGYGADGKEPGMTGGMLQPAMSFVSRVLQVREVPAGTGLGYGHIFTTSKRTRLAVLPVGYEDGYLRVLSNKAEVLVHGRRAPVVGRISMNLTLVDVSEIMDVRPGDEAVLLGSQGNERISADEIAGWMDTISYEVLCLFGHCNSREYRD
ncbi:MAG: alanine racemase [Desulfobulbus sp.]|nr:MAG: alanine racemase [Desulfobulbus sp.]